MYANRRAFTLIELLAVVIILAILAGVAIPRFINYQVEAREASCKGTLGGVRAGITNYYANEAITNGAAAYPSIGDLTKVGEVMQEAIPDNPYTDAADTSDPDNVSLAALADVPARVILGGGTGGGWAYFPGDATNAAVFYANTNTAGVVENSF